MKICPVCSTEYPDDVKFCPNDGQTLRAAAPASDLVGQVFADRYHVMKKLGEGGMAQVYLAELEATTVQETMIKRLTDEPTKLAEARPDLTFPQGLQPVLDTALARSPVERYQTVAKFAADVAALTGRPGSAAVGVVVIRAGAWVALNGGSKNGGARPVHPTRVSRDTAGKTANRQTDRGRRVAARPPAPPPPPPVTRTPTRGLDSARAADSLNTLFEHIDSLSGTKLRNAALDIFNTEGISDKNKAFAAFLAATGWAKLEDTTGNTCAWAQRAVSLDRSSRAYAALQRSKCGT